MDVENNLSELEKEISALLSYRATVPAMLAYQFTRFAELECVVSSDRRLTYKDVQQQSSLLARGLLAAGVGKAARLGILLPNGSDWIVTWCAAERTGALVVSMSTFIKANELGYMIRHSDIEQLIVCNRYLGLDYLSLLEEAFPDLAGSDGKSPLRIKNAPYLRAIWTAGDVVRPWLRGTLSDIAALANRKPEVDENLLAEVEASIAPSDLAIMIYTSGSMAEPKGVVHTHGALARHSHAISSLISIGRTDRVCATVPFFWVGGMLVTMLGAFHSGATLVCPDSQLPEELIKLIRDEGITHLSGWANVLASVMSSPLVTKEDMSRLRPMTDAQRLFYDRNTPREQIPNQLGMTETLGHHSSEPLNTLLPEGHSGSFGRGIAGIERKIVDPETGREVPAGTVGELCIRGYSLMAGLYKREKEDTFDADGWYHTGDRCRIENDGHLYFLGRYGDMIKSSGANIAPAEVENLLRTYPGVVDAAVLGIPDATRGEVAIGVVVPGHGEKLTEEHIRVCLKRDLSSYKVPKRILFFEFDAVPRTDSGKVRKHLLRPLVISKMTESQEN